MIHCSLLMIVKCLYSWDNVRKKGSTNLETSSSWQIGKQVSRRRRFLWLWSKVFQRLLLVRIIPRLCYCLESFNERNLRFPESRDRRRHTDSVWLWTKPTTIQTTTLLMIYTLESISRGGFILWWIEYWNRFKQIVYLRFWQENRTAWRGSEGRWVFQE